MIIYPQILLLLIFVANIGIKLSVIKKLKKIIPTAIITFIYIILLYLGNFWNPLIDKFTSIL
jgi:hypothetical protein